MPSQDSLISGWLGLGYTGLPPVRLHTLGWAHNWLFFNTERGAEAGAGIYSIVETAKANHLNPFWYFTHLLNVLPELRRKYGSIDSAPVTELDKLLPWSKELPNNCHSKRR